MFARIRDYNANPVKGDFYDPDTRAGTVNQDLGFAYFDNYAVEELFETMELSEANSASDIPNEYQVQDYEPYYQELTYKFSEMDDGQKWFSDNGLGLEYGASKGGWAGDYGLLLIRNINKYAEIASLCEDTELKEFMNTVSNKLFDSSSYFFRSAVTGDGYNVLQSENATSARNDGNGLRIGYPIASYTALELNNNAALSVWFQYIDDNRGYADEYLGDLEEQSPHIFSDMVDLQDILSNYKEVEQLEEELTEENNLPSLPMDSDSDFAWADTDGQVVVFKNGGDKAYITFNYRRENWEYNQYARIHFITNTIDRLADVAVTNKGGTFTYQDSTTDPNGNTYTHTRFDGFNEVRYGKYLVGMNQSKKDEEIGQTGNSYELDTLGIRKAKDLMTGEIYESENDEDIQVTAEPGQTVILEVLEEVSTYSVSVQYTADGKSLGYDTITASLGETVTVSPKSIEGYKPVDDSSITITVTEDEDSNVVEFEYASDSAPVFTTNGLTGEEVSWKTINIGSATGNIEFDSDNNPTSITSTGISSDLLFSCTYNYKEVTGDLNLAVTLDHFTRTASDHDYFSMIITDSLELENANYVQLRHFPSNNNILMVSHKADQGDNVTSYWAADMNNKSVPIQFKLCKTGDTIEYSYSTDGGNTFLQTSKPSCEIPMSDKLYVGTAMLSGTEVENTAYISDQVLSTDDAVFAPYEVGKEIQIDLSATDSDGDNLTYQLTGLPDGAVFDKDSQIITWTPTQKGDYIIKAEAYDDYHSEPTTKVKEIVVGETLEDAIANGEAAAIPQINNIEITEGDSVSFDAAAEGAIVSISGTYPDSANIDDGSFNWITQTGDVGIYNVSLTYNFGSYTVSKIVKITVDTES